MLRRKLHESLTVRIFLITLLILLGAGAITFALIAWATPSTYTAVVNEDLQQLVNDNMIEATTDFSRIGECDFVAICVPTPLDVHQQPDTSYMESSAKLLRPTSKRV